jgi:DNA replication licensing factor MCM2
MTDDYAAISAAIAVTGGDDSDDDSASVPATITGVTPTVAAPATATATVVTDFYELVDRPEIVGRGAEQEAEEREEAEAEDLEQDAERDYAPQPELDHYDPALLDERRYRAMTAAQRAAAELELREHAPAPADMPHSTEHAGCNECPPSCSQKKKTTTKRAS